MQQKESFKSQCSLFSDDYDVQLDSDEEPLSLLERRKAERKADSAAAAPPKEEEEVRMGIYPRFS